MTPLILNWHQAYEAGLLTCGGKATISPNCTAMAFPCPPAAAWWLRYIASLCQRDPEVFPWLQRRQSAQTWGQQPVRSSLRRELAHFLDELGHGAVHEADILNPGWSA
ncbi:MAG TPA: hypothetical protein VNP04_28525 [Alphaproteobacteria bacterium]|nr:hypothetical protein [Alphaproteobacteria bacterium]